MEMLLEGEHEALTRKAITLALQGDVTALKLCLDRLAPPRRDSPIKVDLPQIRLPTDVLAASTGVVAAVCAGEITPSEAGTLMALLTAHVRLIETVDLDARVQQLEASAGEVEP